MSCTFFGLIIRIFDKFSTVLFEYKKKKLPWTFSANIPVGFRFKITDVTHMKKTASYWQRNAKEVNTGFRFLIYEQIIVRYDLKLLTSVNVLRPFLQRLTGTADMDRDYGKQEKESDRWFLGQMRPIAREYPNTNNSTPSLRIHLDVMCEVPFTSLPLHVSDL